MIFLMRSTLQNQQIIIHSTHYVVEPMINPCVVQYFALLKENITGPMNCYYIKNSD